MRSIFFSICLLASCCLSVHAQDTAAGNRALTMAELEKSNTFLVKDLDKDSYVKFDNTYILDRSGFGKPYFITGDDGKKKRIDLYKLILKDGRIELGTMIFYTTESGKRYAACMPGYKADGKVWEKYFADIHAIEKEETNFILKLSYVLSKELGFQLYRAATAGPGGKEINREAGTYGNDICFPGEMQVTMADGSAKSLSEVLVGDEIVTVDPVSKATKTEMVTELTVHAAKNYAITKLLLLGVSPQGSDGRDIQLRSNWLEATPNHPMVTALGGKKAGDLKEGDALVCRNPQTGKYETYMVWYKTEEAGGLQKVYNIVAGGGTTFVMNGVIVSQK